MGDYLTNQETAKLLGKGIDQPYTIIDAFDAAPDDQWDLNEGEHFKYISAPVNAFGQRKRRFTEEGIEAIARYLEATESCGLLQKILDKLTH